MPECSCGQCVERLLEEFHLHKVRDTLGMSLSGGEQMSAALAVRLALLKQLTEIRIAFFDEPTTNMDEVRRENLASEIRSITNFDQLFVISHDDTFDNYVDNVIVLGDRA